MGDRSYRQFCPVAMAAEILCTRWTLLLVRELLSGSTRFNALRRGVPRMSPALLSRRLRELEEAGVVARSPVPGETGLMEYTLTDAGQELRPVVESMGAWGQRWVESEPSLDNLDADLLMWDMRRNVDPASMPTGRQVIQFTFAELSPAKQRWWLLVEADGAVDLCAVEPGFDVDLYVNTDLRTMTEVWLGLTSIAQARRDDRLRVVGACELERRMPSWLGLSPFAALEKRVS